MVPPLTLSAPTLGDQIRNSTFGTYPHRDSICIHRLLKPVLAILNDLEPRHNRLLHIKHTSLAYYSYCQSVVQYKRILLQFVPTAAELLNVLEVLHRVLLRNILDRFDHVCSDTDLFSTFVAMMSLKSELDSLGLCESVNQRALQHLKDYLTQRLVVISSALNFTPCVARGLKDERRITGTFADAREYYPPGHCKSGKCNRSDNGDQDGCPDCLQPSDLVLIPQPCRSIQVKPTGFELIMHRSLPLRVLELLGIDVRFAFTMLCASSGLLQTIIRALPQVDRQEMMEDLAGLVHQVMASALKTYVGALALKMSSNDWREHFGRRALGEIEEREKAMEDSILMRVLDRAAFDLLGNFVQNGLCAGSFDVEEWMNIFPAGRKAQTQLHHIFDVFFENLRGSRLWWDKVTN